MTAELCIRLCKVDENFDMYKIFVEKTDDRLVKAHTESTSQ